MALSNTSDLLSSISCLGMDSAQNIQPSPMVHLIDHKTESSLALDGTSTTLFAEFTPYGCNVLNLIPFTVLMEILQYLHPEDLLNMVRTSKAIRKFMLRKRNSSIWRKGLARVFRLPPCPKFLSLPAYAHIVFSTTCHGCGAEGVHNVICSWLVKYCDQCLLKRTSTIKEIPETTIQSLKEMLEVSDLTLTELFPSVIIAQHHRLHLPQIHKYMEDWKRTPDREDRLDLAIAQLRLVVEMKQHATLYAEWIKYDEERKEQERQDALIQKRISDVKDRLEAAGWGPDVRYMDECIAQTKLQDRPLIKQPLELTEEDWLSIFEGIQQELKYARAKRVAAERVLLLRSRTSALDEAIQAQFSTLPRSHRSMARPYYIDLAFKPECRELLEAPATRLVTKEDFLPIVPKLIVRWEEDCKQGLEIWIRKRLPGIPDGVDPFGLAVSFFTCHCHSTIFMRQTHLRWPEVLGHECLRRGDFRNRSSAHRFKEPFKQEIIALKHKRIAQECSSTGTLCPLEPLNISDRGFGIMFDLLQVLGLDPCRTTFDELLDHPTRLVKDGYLHNWSAILYHHRWSDGPLAEWPRFDVKLVEGLEMKEKEAWKRSLSWAPWYCALCHSEPVEGMQSIRQHMREEHGIEDSAELAKDSVMFLHPDFMYMMYEFQIQCADQDKQEKLDLVALLEEKRWAI